MVSFLSWSSNGPTASGALMIAGATGRLLPATGAAISAPWKRQLWDAMGTELSQRYKGKATARKCHKIWPVFV